MLDSKPNETSSRGNAPETKTSFASQASKRRSIIVEDDLKETQNNADRGSSGGGCC